MTENEQENIMQEAKFTWGSCQYAGTAALYTRLCEQEARYSRGTILTEYGLHVGPTVPFEGDLLRSFKETVSIDLNDPEVEATSEEGYRTAVEGIKTVTAALQFLRDQAWDLWSGIPYIAKFIFPGLAMGKVDHEHEIGVLCWLLKSYGYVEDDEAFENWDT